MRSLFFLFVIVVTAWISSGVVVYKNHDKLKKIVDGLPPNTAEDIRKGCSATYEAGRATYNNSKDVFFKNNNNEYAQPQRQW